MIGTAAQDDSVLSETEITARRSKNPMRVLFDIVHPADVLFFKRPIEALQRRGDMVLILSRHKDVTCTLLDEFGFEHRPVTCAGKGTLGLAIEFIHRDWSVFWAVRRFRPNVMIGFGGVAISHAGRLLSVPSVSFYDSENATLQNRITWPFISRLYVPDSYQGPVPKGRTTRIPGTKELSYLHPSAFRPDRNAALQLGLDPDVENFFVRVVAWRANHDLGKSGWTRDTLARVIERLSALGRVHLSTEMPLGSDFAPYLVKGPKTEIHHLLAFCRLLVGESATMASEAAVLGVPAIYAGVDFPGYVKALENANLVINIADSSADNILAAIDAALIRQPADVQVARDRYIAECPDWAQTVLNALDDTADTRHRTDH